MGGLWFYYMTLASHLANSASCYSSINVHWNIGLLWYRNAIMLIWVLVVLKQGDALESDASILQVSMPGSHSKSYKSESL